MNIRPEYFMTTGCDRSHDSMTSERFNRLRDARAAASKVGPSRCWRIIRMSGGKNYTAAEIKTIDMGGPDVEKRKQVQKFRDQYERSKRMS